MVSKNKQILGWGINDSEDRITVNGKIIRSYSVWRSILSRALNKYNSNRNNSYSDCVICEEWKYFSNFKKWYDINYIEGFMLDKDILIKGNKLYSPNTCIFVPTKLNLLLVRFNNRGYSIEGDKYCVHINMYGKYKKIGRYSTKEEAIEAYNKAKINYITEVIISLYVNEEISEKIYRAFLLNFC